MLCCRKRYFGAVLVLLSLLTIGPVVAQAESICEVRFASDHAIVSTVGYVKNVDATSNYVNFDLEDEFCQVHIYWNFPESCPPWLRAGTYVRVSGEYWISHPKHWWEPEIVASDVTPTELPTDLSHSVYVPAPWTIVPWGAAGEVAGSCYQVATIASNILVNCGSFMNTDDMPASKRGSVLDCDAFPFNPSAIDALIVTHAHDDHMARIHYLVAHGFTGEIHMTEATEGIYLVKLDDAVYYSCLPREEKTTIESAIVSSIRTHAYLEPFPVVGNVTATFIDAGHIPGSASVILDLETPCGTEIITFSGDIGSGYHPFLNPPDLESLSQTSTSTLIVESTYGAAAPREYPEDLYKEFFHTVREAHQDGKLVVVPAFALDRTQRVLAALLQGIREGRLPSDLRIGVGGKSSCYLTQTYMEIRLDRILCAKYFSDWYCASDPFTGGEWEFIRQPCTDSKDEKTADPWEYDAIVTPSGTGSSSYAKTLMDRFWGDPNVVFVKVGWAPPWTPIGQGDDGGQIISLHDVFSGHADINGLVAYVLSFPFLKRVIITHGDDGIGAREGLAEMIRNVLPDVEVILPQYGEEISILNEPAGMCFPCPMASAGSSGTEIAWRAASARSNADRSREELVLPGSSP